MTSAVERERILKESWVMAAVHVPPADSRGEHFGVEVWGVIEAPASLTTRKHVQDVVTWWPASRIWTVTHAARGDIEAIDFPCKVIAWQPLPPLPW